MTARAWIAALACVFAFSHARAAPGPGVSSAPARVLAWVPSDVTLVIHQGPGRIAFLGYARSALGSRLPACFAGLERAAAHLYQLSRFPGDHGINAVHGFADRVAVEECASETYRALTGRAVTLERQGRFTRASSGNGSLYLAWSDDGWLYFHEERERVEAMLKRPATPTLAKALRPLLSRVSLADPFWTVYAGDFTTGFIGVPSTGLVSQNAVFPAARDASTTMKLPVTFLFRTEDEARRAVDSMTRSARNTAFSPALRNALSALRPARHGREVDIDMAVFFLDQSAADAAVAEMQKHLGGR